MVKLGDQPLAAGTSPSNKLKDGIFHAKHNDTGNVQQKASPPTTRGFTENQPNLAVLNRPRHVPNQRSQPPGIHNPVTVLPLPRTTKRFPGRNTVATLTTLSILLTFSPATFAQSRSHAEVPEPGTYVHLFATAAIGESLRFNNPFRLSHQLGETGESLSLTPPYGNLGFGAAFGDANGLQHGAAFQWNRSLAGLPQHVVTPSYMMIIGGWRPWLVFGRAGLPVILNPDPNVGGELSLGGAYMLTAGLGLHAEIVGNVFYGAATWDIKTTTIPMLSVQAGIIADFEVLP